MGSSHSSRLGSPISARAIATRCCSPPDSRVGRKSARSAMPTRSSAASARSRPALRGAARVDLGEHHVLEHRAVREQVEGLEDEADAPRRAARRARVVELADVDAVEQVGARRSAGRGSRGRSAASTCPSRTGRRWPATRPARSRGRRRAARGPAGRCRRCGRAPAARRPDWRLPLSRRAPSWEAAASGMPPASTGSEAVRASRLGGRANEDLRSRRRIRRSCPSSRSAAPCRRTCRSSQNRATRTSRVEPAPVPLPADAVEAEPRAARRSRGRPPRGRCPRDGLRRAPWRRARV